MSGLQSSFDTDVDLGRFLGKRRFDRYFGLHSTAILHPDLPDSAKEVLKAKASDFVLPKAKADPPLVVSFETEQEYEGYVVSLNLSDRTFTARVVDLTNNGPDEEGEFSFDELNGDESLVMPGAVFTWSLGVQVRGRTRIRVSEIRFRRLPSFRPNAIQKAQDNAANLSQLLTGPIDSASSQNA